MHKCDKCGKDIKDKPVFIAMVGDRKSIAMETIGRMDLCDECYNKLDKLIEKFVMYKD